MGVFTTCIILIIFLSITSSSLDPSNINQGSKKQQFTESTDYEANARHLLQDSHLTNLAVQYPTYPDELPFKFVGVFPSLNCTGFLISNQIVLTTADCLWDSSRDWFYEDLNWIPARNGINDTERLAVWHTARVTQEFAFENDRRYNYGIVILHEPLLTESVFTITPQNCSQEDTMLNLPGYNFEADEDEDARYYMWWDSCNFYFECDENESSPSKQLFTHDCKGASGMEGGPMIKLLKGQRHKPFLFGLFLSANKGLFFTQEVLDRVQDWILEGK